ncbi:tyrosine-type recombinase/integrase [Pseudoleptotrichia goodfellowii]|uniref:Site-specific recombinase, phage integrase family n=1 Tax=Pseudoleptotrichia goodfellowii F0264 TaxID=596323 RepID=D0GLS1_9FUSO|nr:site-specific integrase [Pseudoleptotrichia goodfellowii]EEY34842.1 site-specific recombinase, phage integrase family [Pseudoleptotrichia goodfellowii F0264]
MRTRKIGKKWYYNFDIYIDGKRKIIEKVGGNTKKEAIEKGEIAKKDYEQTSNSFSQSIATLSDLIEDYRKNYINIFLRENTKRIRNYYFNIIIKDIGDTKLQKMNVRFFQDYIVKTKDPNNIKKFLNSLFNYAVRVELISKNPIKNVIVPKAEKIDFDLITPEDIEIIKNMEIREVLKDFILFIYLTGVRPSEGLALEFKNINFKDKTISIERSINKYKRNLFEPLKNNSSKRKILFNDIIEDIFTRRKSAIEKLIDKSEGYYKSDLIFANSKGNTFIISDFNKEKYKIKEKINKNFHFRALRHMHTTLLIEKGVNIKAVQERLGHADIKTTLEVYAHVTEKMKKEVIPVLDDLLK